MYSQVQIADTINKFQIGAEDINRIREAGKFLIPELSEHIKDFYAWLKQHKEYQIFFVLLL